MAHREIEDFVRDSVSLLTACGAFNAFDTNAAAMSHDRQLMAVNSGAHTAQYYVPLFVLYEDLQTWFKARSTSFRWRICTYEKLTYKQRKESLDSATAQVDSMNATDECVNYLFRHAIGVARIEHRVSFICSTIVPVYERLLGDERRLLERTGKYSAERLHLGSERDDCVSLLSHNETCDVIMVPLHSHTHVHWSLLVYYRIRRGAAGWMAVHYDTANNLHRSVARVFHARLTALVHEHVDKTVILSRDVHMSDRMYSQREGWSCGYRAAAMALFVAREASAFDLETASQSDDALNATIDVDERRSLSYRVGNAVFHRDSFLRNIDDAACARMLADALDEVRTYELGECVRRRFAQI